MKRSRKFKTGLLKPLKKKKTEDSNYKHHKLYSGKSFEFALVGDSMMERWLTTGQEMWEEYFEGRCCNLGVGGDGLQNILFRLQEAQVCLFDSIKVTNTIFLMMGTNNCDMDDVNQTIQTIIHIVSLIRKKQPNPKILIFGIPFRKDMEQFGVNEINRHLKQFVDKQKHSLNLEFLPTAHLYDMESDYADHVHLSLSGYKKWLTLFLQKIF